MPSGAIVTPEEMAREILQVRSALGQVAMYEGILDVSPTAMAVDRLARDHEELEARIDAVMLLLRQHLSPTDDDWHLTGPGLDVVREVARLLRGGTRVPKTPEGL